MYIPQKNQIFTENKENPHTIQAQMWIKFQKNKENHSNFQTFGLGPHQESENSHETDPLNPEEAERVHEPLCNIYYI